MSHHANLVRIKAVYNALAGLDEIIAFVGGATVSLYADQPEQVDVRPTDDIDILVEIGSYSHYARIQEKLASLGFQPDMETKVICRYKYEGLTVDIMPTEEAILGFANRWYKAGFENLIGCRIDDRTTVNIFSPPYFVASKLEAFKGRGKNDGRTSSDFEDIVFVLDNRRDIWKELSQSGHELNNYLTESFTTLLSNRSIEEWLSAHLEYATAVVRTAFILDEMTKFVNEAAR